MAYTGTKRYPVASEAELLRLLDRLARPPRPPRFIYQDGRWRGVEKKGYMPEMFAPEDLEAMERVKKALDPKGLANRGKVLPEVAGAHA